MRTVAERLRRLRLSRSSSLPPWVRPETIDGQGLAKDYARLDEAQKTRYAAFVAHVRAKDCTDTLLRLLGEGASMDAQVEAAKGLQRLLQPQKVSDMLGIITGSPSSRRRELAIYATMSTNLKPDVHLARVLLRLAGDAREHKEVRGQALEALEYHVDARTRPLAAQVISLALRELDLEVRYNAVWAAGALGLRATLCSLRFIAARDHRDFNSGETVSSAARRSIGLILRRRGCRPDMS